ncbi:MAG: hypothetical protein AB1451_15125 [Nitrospirota bacterium]
MIQIEGDHRQLFDGLSGRLKQFALYGEGGPSLVGDYFGAQVDTASLRLFRHQTGTHPAVELEQYFSPEGIHRLLALPVVRVTEILSSGHKVDLAKQERERLKAENRRFLETRLSVLESILHVIPAGNARSNLIVDMRRIFAYSGVSLDIEGDPPSIIPLETAVAPAWSHKQPPPAFGG